MLCPKCKKTIPDGSRFCLECGSAVSSDSQTEAQRAAAAGGASLGGALTHTGPAPAAGAAAPALSLGDLRTLQGAGSAAGAPLTAGSGRALTERYELEAEIGRGGFAVVWRARDRKLGRTVAVKRLLPEAAQGAGGAQTVQRFEREAQAIATLNHRNIVQVFDSDTDADGRYIVMEYVSGGTLRDYLKQRGKLPVAEAVALAMGLCRGLAAAHRQGLIHRDVKPANVLLDPADAGGPVPRLVDFGLSRQGRESDLSGTGYGLGTPYYMAPEQRRDAKSATHTADIYALGKTLYEMVTGEEPDSVDPALVPPPEELGRIILKCIRSNPAERYFSAEDLLRDLEALGTSASAPAPGSAAAGGPACPSCGRRNPLDAKFCEACGTGLMRRCPECDRENALGLRFCGGCGTDVPGFLQVRDALARMQSFAKELKWSRVTKEFGLLAKEVRLPGEKGRRLLADLRKVAQAAGAAEQTLAEMRNALAQAVTARRLGEAGILCRQITELDPTDVAIAAREAEWVPTLQAAAAAVDAGRQALAEQDYRTAMAKADEAQALCADLPAAAELRQQIEAALDRLRELVAEACARVGAVRELTQAGRLAEARTALASLVAEYGEVEVPEDAEVAPDWIAVITDVAAVEEELAVREREAQQRQTAIRRRYLCLAGVAAALTAAALFAWLGVSISRHHRFATTLAEAERRLKAERWQEAEAAFLRALKVKGYEQSTETRAGLKRAQDGAAQSTFDAACVEGDELLKVRRWAEADEAYRRALAVPGYEHAPQAAVGMKAAQAEKLAAEAQAAYAAAVSAAQRAVAAGNWTTAEQEVGKALALDARGSEALSVAAQLEPTLTIAAELDGRDTPGARIVIGGTAQQQTTPASYRLGRGKSYAFSVTLPPANGRFFTTAETRVTADWHGPKTWIAKTGVVHGPAEGQAWTVPELGMAFVYVAPGSFQMGSNDEEYSAKLVHAVRISRGFWLGKYEVIQAEYEAVIGTNPCSFKGARNPVEQVSWHDAVAFCAKLTERERAGGRLPARYEYRLPTEAEWEYAARGGTKSQGFAYSGSNTVDEVAWYYANSGDRRLDDAEPDSIKWQNNISSNRCRTHPVGMKKPNELGLYDMSGNVAEWCLDWGGVSGVDYYSRAPNVDPVNTQADCNRVHRGGSSGAFARDVRSTKRDWFWQQVPSVDLGFRVCLAPATAAE